MPTLAHCYLRLALIFGFKFTNFRQHFSNHHLRLRLFAIAFVFGLCITLCYLSLSHFHLLYFLSSKFINLVQIFLFAFNSYIHSRLQPTEYLAETLVKRLLYWRIDRQGDSYRASFNSSRRDFTRLFQELQQSRILFEINITFIATYFPLFVALQFSHIHISKLFFLKVSEVLQYYCAGFILSLSIQYYYHMIVLDIQVDLCYAQIIKWFICLLV